MFSGNSLEEHFSLLPGQALLIGLMLYGYEGIIICGNVLLRVGLSAKNRGGSILLIQSIFILTLIIILDKLIPIDILCIRGKVS